MYGKLSAAVIIISLFFSSCVSVRHQKLRDMEAYLSEYPDSALVELHKMEDSGLFRRRALHALLMAEALDKTCVDDGKFLHVLGKYEEYYRHHGSLHDRMRFYYYLGDQLSDSNQVNSAVRPFSRALELAEKGKDWFYCGMASEGLADLCYRTYDYDGYLSNMEKSLGFFRKTGKLEHISYAKVRMSGAYMNVKKPEKALELCREVLDSTSDKENLRFALSRMALCYLSVKPPRPDSTIWAVRRLYEENSPLNPYTYAAMARACDMTGNLSGYTSYIDSAYSSVNTRKDRAYVLASEYYVLDSRNDVEHAYPVVKELRDVVDSMSITSMEHSVASLQREFHKEERESEKAALRHALLWLCPCLFLLLSNLCLAVLLFRRRYRKELNARTCLQTEYESLKNDYSAVLTDLSDKKELLDSIMKRDESAELIRLLGKIIEKYVSCGDMACSAVFEDVLEKLYEMKGLTQVLVRISDGCNAGVMGKLRAVSDRLSEHQVLIFAMSSLNFSYETMIAVTGQSKVSLYTQVSRLRKLIAHSSSEYKDFLLCFLPDKSCRCKKNDNQEM